MACFSARNSIRDRNHRPYSIQCAHLNGMGSGGGVIGRSDKKERGSILLLLEASCMSPGTQLGLPVP